MIATARPARADLKLAIGVKWAPVNFTQPVSTTGAGTPNQVLSGWSSTALNNNFGLFILDGRLGFQLGLDLGYSSRHDETTGLSKTDLSFTQFGFSLGSKYYLTRPRAHHVSPYLFVDFYKYFASVSTSSMVPKGYEGFIGGLASPLGIDLAFGAEYFFTAGFSLGAEVLGLKYAYTEGDFGGTATGIGKVSETNHYVTFYTGLTLNYRFDVGVRVQEETEDNETTPSRPRRAPPAAEPQPTPEPPAADAPPPAESVD
jgi:hypothetical protein